MTSVRVSREAVRARRWLAASIMLTACVFVVSHLPLPEGALAADFGTGLGDKTVHSVTYGVLTWCYLMALARGGRLYWRSAAVAGLSLEIAAVDEATQLLVGRQGSAADWLADALGVCLAALAWVALRRGMKKSGTGCHGSR